MNDCPPERGAGLPRTDPGLPLPIPAADAEDGRLAFLLDGFAARYPQLEVDDGVVDLTDCFWSEDAGRFVAPRAFGTLPQARVMAYLARGHAFIAKFRKDDDGRVLREAGDPVIAGFDLEQEVMACLCLQDLRNTSLYEIVDALEGTHRLQGFRRWHTRRIVEAVRKDCPGFCAQRDSCFLFAGDPARLAPRIELNALWLRQFTTLGSRALRAMDAREAGLMDRVFPPEVLDGDPGAIRSRSYMWGRPIWVPASAAFLAQKVARRRQFGAPDSA